MEKNIVLLIYSFDKNNYVCMIVIWIINIYINLRQTYGLRFLWVFMISIFLIRIYVYAHCAPFFEVSFIFIAVNA